MYSILHVDNSGFFSKIVQECIASSQMNVLCANDIDAAFRILSQQNIDLIITGMELRGGGGEFFIKQLNSSDFRDIPVIVLTSNDTMQVRTTMFGLGVVDFIPKDRSFRKKLNIFLNKIVEKDTAANFLKEIRIAVLDDSKIQINVIRNIFTLNKINNADFYDTPQDLLSSDKRYEVYFLDLILPEISGEQVILQLRERYPDSVIIAISGIDNYKVVSNVLLSGADDYMLKPFNDSIFMARLISNVRHYMLVQELNKTTQELKLSSISDHLTQTCNQHHIFECLENAVSEANQNNSLFSLVYVGIDNFEMINERFSHATGDLVLKKTAEVLKQLYPEPSLIGRYGGVEFLLIMPGKALPEALYFAEKIRARVNRIRIKNINLSVSAGVCEHEGESAHELLRKADELLFHARKSGKNCVKGEFDWSRW